jgi:trimethylamine:corrinoid methyltransferase-like protein
VGDDEARQLLAENGCTVDDAGIVTFPRSLIEDCVDRVPSSFTVRGRRSDRDVVIGDGHRAFAPCAGAPNVIKHEEER